MNSRIDVRSVILHRLFIVEVRSPTLSTNYRLQKDRWKRTIRKAFGINKAVNAVKVEKISNAGECTRSDVSHSFDYNECRLPVGIMRDFATFGPRD